MVTPTPLPRPVLQGGLCLCTVFCFFADTTSTCSTPYPDDFANDDIDSYMIAMETTVASEGSRTLPSNSLLPGLQPPCNCGPNSEEEDEAEPSAVPGTPPPKKVGAEVEAGVGRPGGSSLHNSLSPVPVPFAVLWLHPGPGTLPAGPQPRAG